MKDTDDEEYLSNKRALKTRPGYCRKSRRLGAKDDGMDANEQVPEKKPIGRSQIRRRPFVLTDENKVHI